MPPDPRAFSLRESFNQYLANKEKAPPRPPEMPRSLDGTIEAPAAPRPQPPMKQATVYPCARHPDRRGWAMVWRGKEQSPQGDGWVRLCSDCADEIRLRPK